MSRDPAIREFASLVTWDTHYDTIYTIRDRATVVARVIIGEKRKGDREKALAISGLPEPLAVALRRGVELPFQFDLVMEDGNWKID